jgi:hypothetical protein
MDHAGAQNCNPINFNTFIVYLVFKSFIDTIDTHDFLNYTGALIAATISLHGEMIKSMASHV